MQLGTIAIVSSPSSFQRDAEMEKIRAVIAAGSAIFHYEVEKHEDIAEALMRFQQTGVDAIVIVGDRALTSAIFEHIIEKDIFKGADIPLAILPAGDNNIVAENLGATRTEPHMALKTLLKDHQKGDLQNRVVEYPLIKLEGVRGVNYLYGLFFCAGDIIKRKRIFREKISGKGLFYYLRNWLNITRLIQDACLSALGKSCLEDVILINRNQRGAVMGNFFMVLITTMDKAFWGVSIGQERSKDKTHFISVENTPKAVMKTGKLMLRGNYDGIDHVGNIIAEIQHARIVLRTPFVLDGSYYEAAETGELFISVTDCLKFIRLS